MATVYGLLAALCWGATDVLARLASRRLGVVRAMLFGQMPAVALLTAWLAADWRAAPLAAPWWAWAAGIASAQILLGATYALYRGLSTGQVIVVSPVTAAYGAVTAGLASLGGEVLGARAWLGIALTIAGVAVASVPARAAPMGSEARVASGFAWAVLAALGYGIGFWVQGAFAVPSLGAVVPAWLYYVSGVPTLLALFGARLGTWPGRADLALFGGIGLSGAVASIAFCAGLATGQIAVVTVLSSLASGIAVIIARVLLDEPVARHQWAGLGGILFGLICINAAR